MKRLCENPKLTPQHRRTSYHQNPTLGVVTASSEAETSRAKLDVAIFGWVWLIVESENILHMQKLLRAKSSAPEVKNERVETFVCESFYLLLLYFYLLSCLYLLLLSFISCRLRLIGPFNAQSYFQVATFFIYSFSMHKSSKWASHHLHTTSSLIGSLFCSYYSNFSCEDFSMEKL